MHQFSWLQKCVGGAIGTAGIAVLARAGESIESGTFSMYQNALLLGVSGTALLFIMIILRICGDDRA